LCPHETQKQAHIKLPGPVRICTFTNQFLIPQSGRDTDAGCNLVGTCITVTGRGGDL